MSNEESVVRKLRAAGYPFVEVEPQWINSRSVRPDVLAWGNRSDGSFGPAVAVEIKASANEIAMSNALIQLAAIASVTGSEKNYIVINDVIYIANTSFTSATEVSDFDKASATSATITDTSVLERLLVSRLWGTAERQRGGRPLDITSIALEMLRGSTPQGDGLVSGPIENTVAKGTDIAAGVLEAMERISSRSGRQAESPEPLAVQRALVALAGPFIEGSTIFDPFAGFGRTLFEAFNAGAASGARCILRGTEFNPDLRKVASAVLEVAGAQADVGSGDVFTLPTIEADTVITVPPFGLRLQQSYAAPFGNVTDGDVAAVALSALSLKTGGRAVLLTSRGWTFRQGQSAALRKWLSENYRVSALIGLPAVLPSTSIPLLITVIERKSPGETLVAELAEDWSEHLASGSDLINSIYGRGEHA